MTKMPFQLKALEPLDLRKSKSVGDILWAYDRCSFGARMVGEVYKTLLDWISNGRRKSVIVYDGKPRTPLARLLESMVSDKRWFDEVLLPEEYARHGCSGRNVLVVGGFSERHEDVLYEKPERAIFINDYELARPGQVRDGYFPDAIFSDPRFIMPLLYYGLEECLEDGHCSVSELVKKLWPFGGLAQQFAHAANVRCAQVNDRSFTQFFTISGAMTIAQMSLVICDTIELGMAHSITATGALMAHGLMPGLGLKHFKHDPSISDKELKKFKLNRVTDTLEPETNFDHLEEVVCAVLRSFDGSRPTSPREFHWRIGKFLAEHYPNERGILRSAYDYNVPVFVPAPLDSEIGNDKIIDDIRRVMEGTRELDMRGEYDTMYRSQMKMAAERIAIFTIGGGTPRNNDQNDAPFIEIANNRLGLHFPERPFDSGLRIAPDAMHYGHLGGCTYDEGESWRKMRVVRQRFGHVRSDATITWPLITRYVMDELQLAA